MTRYRPKNRVEWLLSIAVLLACMKVVQWMWDDLLMAVTHWQLTLCVLGVGAVVVLGQLGKVDRQYTRVLECIRKAEHGLTREELATALYESRPERLDGVVSSLLEHKEVEWLQRGDQGFVLSVTSSIHHDV